MRGLLYLSLIFLAACKTSRPKDDVLIAVDQDDPGPGGAVAPLPPPPSADPKLARLLDEKVDPVRGGQKILPPYRGKDPCKMALVGESPVAKACSDGGLRAAIEMMQGFVKRAAATGIVFECEHCHVDEDDLSKLSPQADLEFRKLLFLARPAN